MFLPIVTWANFVSRNDKLNGQRETGIGLALPILTRTLSDHIVQMPIKPTQKKINNYVLRWILCGHKGPTTHVI